MKIEGLDSVTRVEIANAIVEFIFKNNLITEDVTVEELNRDEYKYLINEIKYIIIPSYKASSIIDSYNDDTFDDLVTEVSPTYWIDYIDSTSWIRDNGISSLEEYFEEVNGEYIEFIDTYNGIDFYKFV